MIAGPAFEQQCRSFGLGMFAADLAAVAIGVFQRSDQIIGRRSVDQCWHRLLAAGLGTLQGQARRQHLVHMAVGEEAIAGLAARDGRQEAPCHIQADRVGMDTRLSGNLRCVHYSDAPF